MAFQPYAPKANSDSTAIAESSIVRMLKTDVPRGMLAW